MLSCDCWTNIKPNVYWYHIYLRRWLIKAWSFAVWGVEAPWLITKRLYTAVMSCQLYCVLLIGSSCWCSAHGYCVLPNVTEPGAGAEREKRAALMEKWNSVRFYLIHNCPESMWCSSQTHGWLIVSVYFLKQFNIVRFHAGPQGGLCTREKKVEKPKPQRVNIKCGKW